MRFLEYQNCTDEHVSVSTCCNKIVIDETLGTASIKRKYQIKRSLIRTSVRIVRTHTSCFEGILLSYIYIYLLIGVIVEGTTLILT